MDGGHTLRPPSLSDDSGLSNNNELNVSKKKQLYHGHVSTYKAVPYEPSKAIFCKMEWNMYVLEAPCAGKKLHGGSGAI